MEHDSIVSAIDRKAIALVYGRSRGEGEDAENLKLIVKAVNEYEALVQCTNLLQCLIPMALGYAKIHDVGNNKLMVEEARQAIAVLESMQKP